MAKLSLGDKKDPKGNKFWCLGQLGSTPEADCVELECTYNESHEIVDYYLNRMLITQDELIVELADLYDNEQTLRDIMDHELTEFGHKTFLKEHTGEI